MPTRLHAHSVLPFGSLILAAAHVCAEQAADIVTDGRPARRSGCPAAARRFAMRLAFAVATTPHRT